MGFESRRSASRCTTKVEQGMHTFEIVGYSLKKGIGAGRSFESSIFTVAGYNFSILFFPDGVPGRRTVIVALRINSENTIVRGFFDLRFLKHDSGLPYSWKYELKNGCGGMEIERYFLELPESGFIRDDCLLIQCVVTIIQESQLSETMVDSEIEVPRSELSEHFGKLLFEEEGSDVTFNVGGDTFAAHKIVLAARSPVFKAELYGQMRESGTQCITIEDMQAAVFRFLLHFIYTDALPDMSFLEGDDYVEMIRHLLVAADRYAMDRLKLMCQNILAKNLNVDTVATTLALADQHSCDRLKDVCIGFITTSNEIDAILATKGYANLKRTLPSVVVDVFEKRSKLRRT